MRDDDMAAREAEVFKQQIKDLATVGLGTAAGAAAGYGTWVGLSDHTRLGNLIKKTDPKKRMMALVPLGLGAAAGAGVANELRKSYSAALNKKRFKELRDGRKNTQE